MNRIKEVLNEKGITQTELASRLNLTKASITQLLTIGNPNLKTLESIAGALSVPVWELLVSKSEMKVEFSPNVYGVVVINGTTHTIQSVDDLVKLIGSVNQPIQDGEISITEKLKLFSNPDDLVYFETCLHDFGSDETLKMLEICENKPKLALYLLRQTTKI